MRPRDIYLNPRTIETVSVRKTGLYGSEGVSTAGLWACQLSYESVQPFPRALQPVATCAHLFIHIDARDMPATGLGTSISRSLGAPWLGTMLQKVTSQLRIRLCVP